MVGLQLSERNVIGTNAIILLFRVKADSYSKAIVHKMSLVEAKNILYEKRDSSGLLTQHDSLGDVFLDALLPYHSSYEVIFNLYAQSKFGIQCQNKFRMTSVFNMVLNVIVQQKVPAKLINLILRKM